MILGTVSLGGGPLNMGVARWTEILSMNEDECVLVKIKIRSFLFCTQCISLFSNKVTKSIFFTNMDKQTIL